MLCYDNQWSYSRSKITHSSVISHPGDENLPRLILCLLFPEGTTGEVKTTAVSYSRAIQMLITLLQPVLLQSSYPIQWISFRRIFSRQEIVVVIFYIRYEGRPKCAGFLSVCQLLQEWLHYSKGWARSRDAGWARVGLIGRRQAGNKDKR